MPNRATHLARPFSEGRAKCVARLMPREVAGQPTISMVVVVGLAPCALACNKTSMKLESPSVPQPRAEALLYMRLPWCISLHLLMSLHIPFIPHGR